jgi:hypothetical protein
MPPRRPAALAAAIATAAACAPPAQPVRAPTPRVEAVFDVPREYRVLRALPCADEAALVYVVASDGDLYSFQPETLAFRRVGKLGCHPTPGATPNSMAVDRSGGAWINYSDGSIHRASTRDASCSATGFSAHHDGFREVGMAFVSSGPGLIDETLFVWGGRGSFYHGDDRGLARIDRTTLALLPIGRDASRLGTSRSDLTGTGDGKLYGFFSSSPAMLAEIDPATGAILAPRPLPSVTGIQAWAFSFWGGDFYLYWSRFGETSRITKVSGRDGSLQDLAHDIGFRIVGAGVSTCAPTGSAR